MSHASLNEKDDWISYEELVDHISNTNPFHEPQSQNDENYEHADTEINPFYEFNARNGAEGEKSQQTYETPQEGESEKNPFRNGLIASVSVKMSEQVVTGWKGFDPHEARKNCRERIMRNRALRLQQEKKQAKISASRELPPLPPRLRRRSPPPIPPRTKRDYKYTKEQLWDILCSKTYKPPHLPDKLKGSFFKVTERVMLSKIPDAYFSDSEDLHRIRIIVYLLPDQFTFQHDLDEIVKLQRSLKKFYIEYQDKESMKAKRLFSGQAVVVKYEDEWYRAEVKNFDGYSARVQFIDHMHFALFQVNRNDIYYLHRRFEKIPKKSAIGGIDGIVPAEKKLWTKSEINKIRGILPKEVLASVEGYVCSIWKFELFDATEKPLKDIILKHGAAKDATAHHE